MNIINQTNIFFQKPKIKCTTAPNFKANSTQEHNTDTQNVKQENPYKYLEYGLYALGGIAILSSASLLVNGLHKKVEKLYKEKLALSNLPEKIEFKAAKTLEEAKRFAQNVLGIKDVDNNFTLEALNFTNKSIVDVSNVNKGKLYMPSALKYKELKDKTLAYVDASIHSDSFGELAINKNFFNEEKIQKYLNKHLKDKNNTNIFIKSNKTDEYTCIGRINEIRPIFEKNLTPILDKFYTDSSKLTLEEKLILQTTIQDMFYQTKLANNPDYWYKQCEQIIKNKNFNISLEEYSTKNTNKERAEFLTQIIKNLREKHNSPIIVNIRKGSPEYTIYHEMGHLQDFGKNLKDIDLKQLETNKDTLIKNRWGGLGYDDCEKIWNKDKNEFKEKFPDLYEFLTNEEFQKTAGKISSYAKTGIGEFIAETYALMIKAKIHGEKIADDIQTLYKKYNGPMLNEV